MATKVVGGGVSFSGGLATRGAHPRISVGGGVTDFEDGPLRSLEGTIPTASVLTLNSAPVELVPAPGAGKVLQFLGLILILDYSGVAYANGGAVAVQSGAVIISGTIAATFINGTADGVKQMVPITDVVLAPNTALTLKAATADFITGTSPLRYKIFYAVHDTGL